MNERIQVGESRVRVNSNTPGLFYGYTLDTSKTSTTPISAKIITLTVFFIQINVKEIDIYEFACLEEE